MAARELPQHDEAADPAEEHIDLGVSDDDMRPYEYRLRGYTTDNPQDRPTVHHGPFRRDRNAFPAHWQWEVELLRRMQNLSRLRGGQENGQPFIVWLLRRIAGSGHSWNVVHIINLPEEVADGSTYVSAEASSSI